MKTKRATKPAGPEEKGFPPYQKLLVPVDFSTPSLAALDDALAVATAPGASLVLLHVLDAGSFAQSLETIPGLPDVETRARDAQQDLLALARKKIPRRVPVEAVVRVGVPHDEITRAATVCRADLIVIATHGRSGLKHILLGSTAERVVRHAHIPVLVVRRREGRRTP